MVPLHFETLSFAERDAFLDVTLLRLFATSIPKEEVEQIAPFSLADAQTLEFQHQDPEKVETRFSFLLAKSFETLKTKLTGNPATYVHRHSGLPLLGHVTFGIVYRNSSIIEIKPVTSCNLDCVYCSISEGLSSTKHDFVVEKDYLLEELDKLLVFVAEPVEVHIGVQGEPFLYADLELLFADLQAREQIHTISIDTNGTLLNREKINRLASCTKLQLNLSLDALDPEKAKVLAGVKGYTIEHVKDVIAYASKKLNVIVAPVLTKGYNEEEMEKIIAWIKTLDPQPKLGIQNFLRYETGRKPAEEIPWEEFYALLDAWEKKYDIKLRWSKEDFLVKETKELPKPFSVGDEVMAIITCRDRFQNSVIAVAQGRTISVPGVPLQKGKKIRVRITRDKHNIFVGEVV